MDQLRVRLRRKRQLLRCLLNGQIGGKLAQAAPRMGGGGADFLLGCGHNALALFLESSLDALLVFQALLLHLGTESGNLIAQPGQLGLHCAQSLPRLFGSLARQLPGCGAASASACGRLWAWSA